MSAQSGVNGKPDREADSSVDGKPDGEADSSVDGKPDGEADSSVDGKPNISMNSSADDRPNVAVNSGAEGQLNTEAGGNVKVSVIVPVYNAERHLPRCLDSLLAQTLTECEFICIDDGSTDGSGAVIERYRRRDGRIRLLRQSNGGVSSARNAGLAAATGQYIGFVDADDCVSRDMFGTLYGAASQDGCDIVLSNFESELNGSLVVTRYDFPADVVLDRHYIRRHVLPLLLRTETLNTACNRLYRAGLIVSGDVRFPVGVALGEDGWFNMHALAAAATMKYVDYTGYHYCEVEGSATRSAAGRDYFKRALEVYAMEPPPFYKDLLDEADIARLKSVKLIHSVLANIAVYTAPDTGIPLPDRLACVRNMIANETVRRALPAYREESGAALGRYQKALLQCIEWQSAWGLYLAAGYSRFRNRRKRRNIG